MRTPTHLNGGAAAWLRTYSIRVRMLGAVVMVLAMFAAIAGATLWAGATLRTLNTEMVGHSLTETRALAALRSHLATVRLHEKQMVIDYEDAGAVGRHRAAWNAAIDAVRADLNAMTAGSDDADNAIARGALQELEAYAKASAPVLAQVEAGGYDTARVVDRMLGRAKEHVAKVEAALEQIDRIVDGEARAATQRFQDAMTHAGLVFGAVLAVVLAVVVPMTLLNSRSITGPIAHASSVARAIAEGDLTRPIDAGGRDEAADLLRALQRMQTVLGTMVGDVHQASGSIRTASEEVASGNADLSSRTEQAASSLQQTASSVQQLTGTVAQGSDSARQAAQLAGSAAEVAQRGGQVVAQVVSTMDEISAASRRIGDIIGTIDGIAFQTNILALNAAVEAARAGEQGRGFAVVAGEVRALAGRSAEAAREIKSLVGGSVERVDTGARLVADAGATMQEIVASVQRVAAIVGEISAATAEQHAGIAQVNGAVGQLDRMTQQNAALVEQSAAAAESLKQQAQRLSASVAAFLTHGTRAAA